MGPNASIASCIAVVAIIADAEIASGREAGLQIVAYYHGRKIVEVCAGCACPGYPVTPNTRFMSYSHINYPLRVHLATQQTDAHRSTGNTIHASDDNLSNQSRIAMIATMNTRANSPDPKMNTPGHPCYTKQRWLLTSVQPADVNLPLPNFSAKYCHAQ